MKIICIAFLLVVMLGCKNNRSLNGGVSVTEKSMGDVHDNVYKFTFEGHRYIQFGRYNQQWGIHDPECELNDQKFLLPKIKTNGE